MSEPLDFYLTVSTHIGCGQITITQQVYGQHGEPLGEHRRIGGTSFCLTWQDLARWVEEGIREAGGTLNESLNRPSPFVDLT